MASPASRLLIAVCLLAFAKSATGQESVLPPADFHAPGVSPFADPAFISANGMALAQNDAAIERARLRREATPPTTTGVDENGSAVATSDSDSSDDDSFGAQMILKSQDRLRSFVVTGSVSGGYTNNVALTRRGERSDVFGVLDAGIGWSRRLSNEMEANLGAHISVFRYNRTSSLDFESLGFGAGLSWTPQRLRGTSFFARYDFTELLDSHVEQILMEHAVSVGVQKTIALGRSHGVAFGLSAAAELADPGAAERQQVGAFVTYHLQLTRKWDVSVLYRPAVYFYSDTDRTDLNQIFSFSAHYHFREWADFNASFSYGLNRSDRSVFDYDVLTSGASVGFSIRF